MSEAEDSREPIVGGIYRDARGETFLRIADLSPEPKPWRFIDVPAGIMEPRSEGFPHEPLHLLTVLPPGTRQWPRKREGDDADR